MTPEEVAKKIADILIDKECELYDTFGDDRKICVGIKVMADEVREFFAEGRYLPLLECKCEAVEKSKCISCGKTDSVVQ